MCVIHSRQRQQPLANGPFGDSIRNQGCHKDAYSICVPLLWHLYLGIQRRTVFRLFDPCSAHMPLLRDRYLGIRYRSVFGTMRGLLQRVFTYYPLPVRTYALPNDLPATLYPCAHMLDLMIYLLPFTCAHSVGLYCDRP